MTPARTSSLVASITALAACQAVYGIGNTELERRDTGGSAGQLAHAGGNADPAGATGAGVSGADASGPGVSGADSGDGGHAGDGATAIGGAGASGLEQAGGAGMGGTPNSSDEAIGGAAGLGGTSATGGMSGTGGSSATGGSSGTAGVGDGPQPTVARIARGRFLWSDPALKVCIRVEDPANAELRARQLAFANEVRELVEGTWIRSADLGFGEWTECGLAEEFILDIKSSGQSRSELGDPGGTPRVVTLSESASNAEIVYVWGRALGLEHEYGRNAFTGECVSCDNDDQCDSGTRRRCLPSGFCGDPRDQESIMAAPDCGGVGAGRRFSAWDAIAIQRAYGKKRRGSLVDAGGRCLVGGWPKLEPGARPFVYPCLDDIGHAWERSFAGAPAESDWLRLDFPDRELCMEAQPLDTFSAPIALAACSRAAANQDVRFRSVLLRTFGSQCVATDAVSQGAALSAESCSAPTVRRWSVRSGRIELADSGLCAAVQNGAFDLGVPIVLEPCDPSDLTQNFELAAREIRYFGPERYPLCVAMAGDGPTGPLILWPGCGFDMENFTFYMTGPVELGGHCLSLLNGYSRMDGPVGVSACNGSVIQEWDFYW